MSDKSDEAETLQQALHLALQIDPAETTDATLLAAWRIATQFQSALDCYQRAAARVQACDLDVARAIAEGDTKYWTAELEELGKQFLQLHASGWAAAARRKRSA